MFGTRYFYIFCTLAHNNTMNVRNMQRSDDNLLVVKLKDGSVAAFEILYEKYSAKLYNSVSLISYDKSLAKDITQTTFLTVWEKRESLDPHKSFSAYLYTIARNLVYKETERLILNNKFVESRLTDTTIYDDNTVDNLNSTYIEDYINLLVDNLDEIPRKIFVMKKEENLSTKEISEKLGISEKAVESHFYRLMKWMKEKLRDYMMLYLI